MSLDANGYPTPESLERHVITGPDEDGLHVSTRVRVVRPEIPPPDHGCKAGGPSCLRCALAMCVLDAPNKHPEGCTCITCQPRRARLRERYETDQAFREHTLEKNRRWRATRKETTTA